MSKVLAFPSAPVASGTERTDFGGHWYQETPLEMTGSSAQQANFIVRYRPSQNYSGIYQ